MHSLMMHMAYAHLNDARSIKNCMLHMAYAQLMYVLRDRTPCVDLGTCCRIYLIAYRAARLRIQLSDDGPEPVCSTPRESDSRLLEDHGIDDSGRYSY